MQFLFSPGRELGYKSMQEKCAANVELDEQKKHYLTSKPASSGKSVQCTAFLTLSTPNLARKV